MGDVQDGLKQGSIEWRSGHPQLQAKKRFGSLPVSLNFSSSVRSWIDKPWDLGLLFSHRNIRPWVNFLGYLKIKNKKTHQNQNSYNTRKTWKDLAGGKGVKGGVKKELCTKRLTRQHEAMETKGGKRNPVQNSQPEGEKGEQLECAHQDAEPAGGQPRLQGGRVRCRTRWGSLPALALALGETGRREAGGLFRRVISPGVLWEREGETGFSLPSVVLHFLSPADRKEQLHRRQAGPWSRVTSD